MQIRVGRREFDHHGINFVGASVSIVSVLIVIVVVIIVVIPITTVLVCIPISIDHTNKKKDERVGHIVRFDTPICGSRLGYTHDSFLFFVLHQEVDRVERITRVIRRGDLMATLQLHCIFVQLNDNWVPVRAI